MSEASYFCRAELMALARCQGISKSWFLVLKKWCNEIILISLFFIFRFLGLSILVLQFSGCSINPVPIADHPEPNN